MWCGVFCGSELVPVFLYVCLYVCMFVCVWFGCGGLLLILIMATFDTYIVVFTHIKMAIIIGIVGGNHISSTVQIWLSCHAVVLLLFLNWLLVLM